MWSFWTFWAYFAWFYFVAWMFSILYLGALKMAQLANLLQNFAAAGPRQTLSIAIGVIFVLIGIIIFGFCLPILMIFWALSRGLEKANKKLNIPIELEDDTAVVPKWEATQSKKKSVKINDKVVEPAVYDGKDKPSNQ